MVCAGACVAGRAGNTAGDRDGNLRARCKRVCDPVSLSGIDRLELSLNRGAQLRPFVETVLLGNDALRVEELEFAPITDDGANAACGIVVAARIRAMKRFRFVLEVVEIRPSRKFARCSHNVPPFGTPVSARVGERRSL